MREKATLDLIEKRESTDYYISKTRVFSRLRTGIGFDHLHAPMTEGDIGDRQSVIGYLNHYELVALGILRGVLDNDFYFQWMGTSFVREWKAAEEFIWRMRFNRNRKETGWTYNEKVYEHFEKVACSWDPTLKPLIDRGWPWPLDEEAGPADAPIPHLAEHAPPLPVD